MKKIPLFNCIFYCVVFTVAAFFIGLVMGSNVSENYQYINTENNSRAGITTYTMIYLHNGETKYLHYDDPKTEYNFIKITEMEGKK